MKNSLFAGLLVCFIGGLIAGCGTTGARNHGDAAPSPQIYEWRIYTLAPGADTTGFDDFFRGVLLPAYNKHGVEVGAFAPATSYREYPAGARYLFMAWPDIETFRRVSRSIREDAGFLAAGVDYFDASAPNPAYTNLETYLCEAFDSIPVLRRPAAERGLLEFRNYRSPNVEANERKIKMFQSGEIAIFDEVGINSVCYGRTLAGPRMPSLTYLTWYKDAATRAEAWRRFGRHPEWARISSLPEYAHTATDNVSRLLVPLPYSQY